MSKSITADAILDRALELGNAYGWDAVRLHTVAASLDIPLNEVRKHYPQKDDLSEAWFDRADSAALAASEDNGFATLTERLRLAATIMAWLNSLQPHRRLTRTMLGYKLEPGHLHLQALGIMRISRTVQWFMESARLEQAGIRRTLLEVALTAVYLTTFSRWLFDGSPGSADTRRYLEAALQRLEKFPGMSGNVRGRQDADDTRTGSPATRTGN